MEEGRRGKRRRKMNMEGVKKSNVVTERRDQGEEV